MRSSSARALTWRGDGPLTCIISPPPSANQSRCDNVQFAFGAGFLRSPAQCWDNPIAIGLAELGVDRHPLVPAERIAPETHRRNAPTRRRRPIESRRREMLGMAAGAIGASGYNLATDLVPPERQGTVASLVSVVLALGSVVVSVAGGEVLKATQVPGTFADGAPVSTATGVHLYVIVAGMLFVLAAVPALTLTRNRRTRHPRTPTTIPTSAPNSRRLCGR